MSRFPAKLLETYRVGIRRVESTGEAREFLREEGVIEFGEIVHEGSAWVYETFEVS